MAICGKNVDTRRLGEALVPAMEEKDTVRPMGPIRMIRMLRLDQVTR